MLAWVESPGTGDRESYADSVAWEGLDGGFCTAIAEVAVNEDGEAEEALEAPKDDDYLELGLGGEAVEMVPECYERGDDESDVEVEERFVKGFSDDGAGL